MSDPQGSALGFSWAASTGTVGTPTSSTTTSEVIWTAPACVSGGGSASIVATVSNALGLSTSTTFTVVGLPECTLSSTWTTVGGLSRVRVVHTATLLPSGQVLLVGGDGPPLDTEEVFDPETGLSAPVPSSGSRRISQTATLLPSGKVLVTGGAGASGTPQVLAELYDPATGTWSPAGTTQTGGPRGTATLLPTGKVLVAGGDDSGVGLAPSELFDPETETWALTEPMARPRQKSTATLLASGKVLVVGGYDWGPPVTTAELYDPVTGHWAPAGDMAVYVADDHTATLLPSGQVLVTRDLLGVLRHDAALHALRRHHGSPVWEPEPRSRIRGGRLDPEARPLLASAMARSQEGVKELDA